LQRRVVRVNGLVKTTVKEMQTVRRSVRVPIALQGGYTDRRILINIGSIIIKHTIRNDDILRYLRYQKSPYGEILDLE